ncbi:hypothetical protein GN956_G6248 [Arapaima gigas]
MLKRRRVGEGGKGSSRRASERATARGGGPPHSSLLERRGSRRIDSAEEKVKSTIKTFLAPSGLAPSTSITHPFLLTDQFRLKSQSGKKLYPFSPFGQMFCFQHTGFGVI